MVKFKRGDVVKVLNTNWNGEVVEEGMATCVKRDENVSDSHSEYWEVHFEGDAPKETYMRFIQSENKI